MKYKFSIIALAACLTAGTAANAAVLLNDSFGSQKNTITGTSDGQTGTLAGIDRVERNFDGNAIVDAQGRLRFEITSGSSGASGAMVYYDNNFTGLTAFTVTLQNLTGSSAGDGRYLGFSVGQSKNDLDIQASVSPSATAGDFFIGYDEIGGTTGLGVWHNGTSQGYLGSPTLSPPDTLSVVFTFANQNAGTALDYSVYLDDAFVGSGSTAWSGTDENYIAMQSNYTGFNYVESFEITNVPEPSAAMFVAIGSTLCLMRRRR